GSVTIENNYMESVSSGVTLFTADGATPNGPVLVRFNQVKNLDGVPSDGKGGRVLSPLRFGQDNGNHFFSIANSNNLQGVDISWNEVVNEPFVSSVGSLIDISSSSGSATGFIDIHDNFLQGGY